MKYSKTPLSIEQQIEKLKQRGLVIKDENSAANYLSNISYYRLRAFAILSAIQYIVKIISPESNLKNNLVEAINNGGELLNPKDMGFPKNWQTFGVWK
jgi:abortive infection bacteriophage resistance protein